MEVVILENTDVQKWKDGKLWFADEGNILYSEETINEWIEYDIKNGHNREESYYKSPLFTYEQFIEKYDVEFSDKSGSKIAMSYRY